MNKRIQTARCENSGVAWTPAHAIKFSNPYLDSANSPPVLLWLAGDGVIILMLQTVLALPNPPFPILSRPASRRDWPSLAQNWPFLLPLWPSVRPALLARFQVNQRQIQGRAQPNFGPPSKVMAQLASPPFILSRNGRPLTIGPVCQ